MSGLTLVELLIAVVILGLLAGLGVPALNAYNERSFRAEARADLMACVLALERRAGRNFTYAGAADGDGDGLGDADAGPVAAEVCRPVSQAQGRYRIELAGADAGFVLTATPDDAGSMAGDGFMTVDQFGLRQWDRDNDGQIGPDEARWD